LFTIPRFSFEEFPMSALRPFRFAIALIVLAGLTCLPVHAESKDMIQLQTQMQQLQDAIARLQQSNDERMGVMKDLVQQTADAVYKMSIAMNGLQLSMQNQGDAATTKNEQLSGQIQSLNDSLDELKARMARMEKSIGNIENQQQSANAMLGSLPQGGAPAAAQGAPGNSGPAPQAGPGLSADPNASATVAAPVAAGPSAGDMYRRAYSDYVSAKYPLAASEFGDLTKAYPDDPLAGNAFFYMGEIDGKQAKPTAAVKNYDQVLERYPDNTKTPAAHLHKAYALLSMRQNEKGVAELKALLQRFPNSPEASQARAKLSTLRAAR
jgi:TolA-binding protein